MNADELKSYLAERIAEIARAVEPELLRKPLVGFVSATDPIFAELRELASPTHRMPQDLLEGARTVVSFFLPFSRAVVEANEELEEMAAREWVDAYLRTNALILKIGEELVSSLADQGTRAFMEPPTGNFDRHTLTSSWSHKSVAVAAGLGSFGLHYQVITDSGCAGRFGSLVLDADLEARPPKRKERCLYYYDGSCLECVIKCPVGAIEEDTGIDKELCWRHCLKVAHAFRDLGLAEVCGKCATGACALASAVAEWRGESTCCE